MASPDRATTLLSRFWKTVELVILNIYNMATLPLSSTVVGCACNISGSLGDDKE